MKRLSLVHFLAIPFAYFATSCGPKEYTALGDQNITVFEHQNIHFVPGEYDPNKTDDQHIFHLANGRLLLKKIALPDFQRTTNAFVDVTLTSNGDPWDKSGSCFVIPAESKVNFLSIAQDKNSFPEIPKELETCIGVVSGKDYKPAIELMRFMTPFGVGYYSDTLENRRPVYIPKWEKEVHWKQDITDRISRLEGDVWVGVWIDAWTPEGYNVDMSLSFKESGLAYDVQKQTHAEPLVNTVYYLENQEHTDIFARRDIQTVFDIPAHAKNIRLKYITTGHGGHDGGDEFVKKENILYMDGKKVYSFTPWRDDCASFRRFSPHSGVWTEETQASMYNLKTKKSETKTIDERIASSDYSRSNWCPGTDVTPVEVALENVNPGKHTFAFSIPNAQEKEGDKLNHWLISAYLVWDE